MNCPHCNIELKLVLADKALFANQRPSLDISDVGELLQAIDPQSLDDKSRDFVKETRERYEKWHDRIKMSPKQMQWLQNLAQGVERF